jgi:hypothetical protein
MGIAISRISSTAKDAVFTTFNFAANQTILIQKSKSCIFKLPET